MRIWSLHPSQLDPQGLSGCWRETLLAQSVLRGDTRGYRNHPQLVRFKALADPVGGIARYLKRIADEADARNYNFNRMLIVDAVPSDEMIDVTEGQVRYEWQHLLAKLQSRSPEWHARFQAAEPIVHPLFRVVPGEIESWEVLPQGHIAGGR